MNEEKVPGGGRTRAHTHTHTQKNFKQYRKPEDHNTSPLTGCYATELNETNHYT